MLIIGMDLKIRMANYTHPILFIFIREMYIVYYERKIKDVKDEKPKGLLRREKANLLVKETVNTN